MVGTTVGGEGYEPRRDSGIIVADSPLEFARVILEIYSDPEK